MITPELLAYISRETVAGKTKDQIKLALIQSGGWKGSDVDEAFAHLDHPAAFKKERRHSPFLTTLAILVLIVGAIYFVMQRFNIHSFQDVLDLITRATNQQGS